VGANTTEARALEKEDEVRRLILHFYLRNFNAGGKFWSQGKCNQKELLKLKLLELLLLQLISHSLPQCLFTNFTIPCGRCFRNWVIRIKTLSLNPPLMAATNSFKLEAAHVWRVCRLKKTFPIHKKAQKAPERGANNRLALALIAVLFVLFTALSHFIGNCSSTQIVYVFIFFFPLFRLNFHDVIVRP
jgi:hypothetical protein